MLFNLTHQEIYKCEAEQDAIWCSKECGPCFGGMELAVIGSPFNGKRKCSSNAKEHKYKIGLDQEKKNNLTKL